MKQLQKLWRPQGFSEHKSRGGSLAPDIVQENTGKHRREFSPLCGSAAFLESSMYHGHVKAKLVATLLGLRSLKTTAMRLLEVWNVGTKLMRTPLQSHHFMDGETEALKVKQDAQGHT